MCITLLIHHEIICDMQTLTEPIDELTHIIRALSKEEQSDQWRKFLPHPPGPPLRTATQDQESYAERGERGYEGGCAPLQKGLPSPDGVQTPMGEGRKGWGLILRT